MLYKNRLMNLDMSKHLKVDMNRIMIKIINNLDLKQGTNKEELGLIIRIMWKNMSRIIDIKVDKC